jgi:hypothetical protein
MSQTTCAPERTSRGPVERLARRIARKAKMIEEYERIAGECNLGDRRGQEMHHYFRKRAADFAQQKQRLEAELQAMLARRRPHMGSLNGSGRRWADAG